MIDHRTWREETRKAEQWDQFYKDQFQDPAVPQEIDQQELEDFEAVIVDWLLRMQGETKKAQAIQWLSQMLGRLRVRLGYTPDQAAQLEQLDKIAMTIVSDQVLTVDGKQSIKIDRISPKLAHVTFDPPEDVTIIEDEADVMNLPVVAIQSDRGMIAARELRFRDAATGEEVVKHYSVINKSLRRIKDGKVDPNWMTEDESYALRTIRHTLREMM